MPRPSRTVVLVATAGLLAGACAWDLTSSPVNLAVALGASVVLAVVCWRGGLGPVSARGAADVRSIRIVVAGILLLGVVAVAIRPVTKDVTAGWLLWVGIGVLGLSTVLTWVTLWRPGRTRRRIGWAALAAAPVGLAFVVGGSRRPRIDVWVLLQDAARGVLTGRNPYTLTFPGAPRGQTTECFTYLPGSFLLTAPGRLVGDVRWSELAVVLTGWLALTAALRWRASRRVDAASHTLHVATGLVLTLVTFALVTPATARVVQQSWTDTLLLGLVLLAVALVICDRSAWAMVPLAFALATKQHVVLLLPLVLMWWGWRRCLAMIAGAALICAPWLLAAPGRMWTCGVTFFLDLPATTDSISFWRFLPGPLRPLVVVALTVGAFWLCWRRLPRTPAAFLLAAATVNAAFDLANKQSYLNQWWFVAQLVFAAAVVAIAAPDKLSGVTTGAVAGTGEPSADGAIGVTSDVVETRPPDRRHLLRWIGATALASLVAGCSLARKIGGPGTSGDPGTTDGSGTPTPRPTVLATAVPALGTADAASVAAAVGLVVGAAGHLEALALRRPDLRPRLVATRNGHQAHIAALAELAGTPVPPSARPTTPRPTPGTKKPTTAAFLASAASIERTLGLGLTGQAIGAVDPDVATLLASVAASATGWQAALTAASTTAPATGGG